PASPSTPQNKLKAATAQPSSRRSSSPKASATTRPWQRPLPIPPLQVLRESVGVRIPRGSPNNFFPRKRFFKVAEPANRRNHDLSIDCNYYNHINNRLRLLPYSRRP